MTWDWLSVFGPENSRLWYKLFVGFYMGLSWVYFASALKQEFSLKKNVVLLIGSTLFSWVWNIIGGIEPIIYLPGFYAALIIFLILVYRQDWRNAVFLALIHYFTMAFVPRLMWWIYRTVGGQIRVEAGVAHWDEFWIYQIAEIVILVNFYFVRKLVRKIADYVLPTREFFSIMILLFPLALISYGLNQLSAIYNVDFPIGLIIIWSVMSVGVIFNMVLGRKQQQELLELHAMELRLREQYQRYQIKAESSELIMQKCHDLQKHLRLFQETNNQGYLDDYQAELKATIDACDTVYETGNAILDTVLSEAARKCRVDNISLICMADGSLVDFIQPVDISSIFGNALENAIESTRGLTAPEKKIIHLKIFQEKYLLMIRVENYYEHEIKWQDGQLVTGKEDRANHGYGLKSIRYTVEKYHGSVKVEAEDGKFTLAILIHR